MSPEYGNDGSYGIFSVLLLGIEFRDAFEGGPEVFQFAVLAVDLQQLVEDLHLVVLEPVLLSSSVEGLQLLHSITLPAIPNQSLDLEVLQLHSGLHVLGLLLGLRLLLVLVLLFVFVIRHIS